MGSKKDNPGPFLLDVDHEGHPGYTVADLINNLQWMFPDFDPQPLPQIVILMIGTNDFLQYSVRFRTEDAYLHTHMREKGRMNFKSL